MNEREANIAAVAEALGKPAGFEIPEAAVKIRKSLLTASIALLCLLIGEIKPGDSVNIAGITLDGITSEKIIFGLLIIVIFSLVHYGTYVLETYTEWRLRATGAKLAFQTGSKTSNPHLDYPNDPRQSSLSHWWLGHSRRMLMVEEYIDKANSDIEEVKRLVAGRDEEFKVPYDLGPTQMLVNLMVVLGDLKAQIEVENNLVNDARVIVSLRRFDDCHKTLLNIQGGRVLLIEIVMPLFIGLSAFCLALSFLITPLVEALR